MIKKIEVWNFECWKHAVLDNLDKGLNLIYGDSDSGKTSLVRAVKLVAYNDFDPASVRTGCKNCRVKITTDKGYIDVERGTKNIWKVCRTGEAEQVFEKIGKSILPQAAEIMGLHIVELGDMKLPVNIMDQNEGHFMLNELGGDNASGSMRAQIVDEISGLSGIEGLIKEVSLDRHRFGRAMKENEDHALKLRESMHNKGELKAEDDLLSEVEGLLSEREKARESISVMADLFEEHHDMNEEAAKVKAQIDSMPNTKALKTILGQAQEVFDEAEAMLRLHLAHKAAQEAVDRNQAELDALPDLEAASKAINACEMAIRKAKKARKQADELVNAMESMDKTEESLSEAEVELAEAIKERTDALSDIDVCPLSDRPISKGCIENIKYPVKR